MTDRMRVLHVNDVAGVGSSAVAQARAQGLDWDLWPLPPVRGAALPVKVARRVGDLARFHRTGRRADLLHVHYGLFGYYAWSVRRPYVLHLHGTDVRVNLQDSLLRPLVGRAIERAAGVAYSTPDLESAVKALRPDAIWIPAPLAPALAQPVTESTRPGREGPRVVFASRWDPVKGLDELVDVAVRLRAQRPDAVLVGVDWGVGAERAADVGVRLEPVMSGTEFRSLLGGADVVIGQLVTGSLGVSELEALALGRPLVCRFAMQQAYGDEPPMWNTAQLDPVLAALAILDDPVGAAATASASREWALRHHSPERFVDACQRLYRGLR